MLDRIFRLKQTYITSGILREPEGLKLILPNPVVGLDPEPSPSTSDPQDLGIFLFLEKGGSTCDAKIDIRNIFSYCSVCFRLKIFNILMNM
jgi:hypothetical protein